MTKGSESRRGLAALIPTGDDRVVSITDTRTPTKRPSRTKTAARAAADERPVVDAGPPESAPVQRTSTVNLSDGAVPVDGLELISVRPNQIVPNPKQPRTEFDPDALMELAHSLGDVGFLQPVVVRPLAASANESTPRYELVAGERRWRASQLAELATIPAIVRSTDDDALLRDALLENLQRVALNPLEEAAAYDQLLVDFGGTHDELAVRLGRSRPQVSNTLRLLKLPTAVQRRVAAGVLSAGHARALLSVGDPATMESLAKRAVSEGISVRGLEEIVAVGKPAKNRKSPRTQSTTAPEIRAVADRLSDALDTRVQITMGKAKGKIVVEFSGVDDLHRIVSLLNEQVLTDSISTS
ncbi:MAG: ParB/RepB/Spo0J family partition protein [Actinobacteria bacterium]|nr:ParB/RepB/Spo0J family partition protein [Actinomycetota bacterium]